VIDVDVDTSSDIEERPPRGLRPLSTDAVVRIGLGVVALTLLGYALTGATAVPLLGAAVVGFAGAAYLATFTSPAWLVSIGLALTVFSGNSDHLGFPIGPDRIMIAGGLAAIVVRTPGAGDPERTIVWRPLHAVLAAVAGIGVVSAYAAGTLLETEGLFALLDVLGIVPFTVFTLSPLIYANQRDRNAFLTVLVGTGAYLGVVGLLEGTHNLQWVLPRYIADGSVGIHFGRARGPFAEAVAMGLGLYGCAVASAIAYVTWTTRLRRRVAAIVCLLCLASTIFTLTRAVWLATAVATTMALLTNRRTRRVLLPIGAIGTVTLIGALSLLPGFADSVSERSSDQRPLWDRYNTNHAAIEMVLAHPLTGIGWHAFEREAPAYMEVSQSYPLTGVGIPVHNVPLSHAVEIGVPAAVLWAIGLVFAVGGAVLRPGPESLDPWRLGMVALFIHWMIVASFGPLTYAFPNLLLWTWAGVCSIHHLSVRNEQA
jgi:putative inorganic carbon (HCO3(-)) transporter